MSDASARVRAHLQRWIDKTHAEKTDVGRAVGGGTKKNPGGWIDGFLKGRQDFGLRYLDPLAELMGRSPADLVAYDVTPDVTAPLVTSPPAKEEQAKVLRANYVAGVMMKVSDARRRRLFLFAEQIESEHDEQEADRPHTPGVRKRRGSA